jgi:hypothetical protein
MPRGFLLWEQIRSSGNHKDREFRSPDGMFSFRSRTSAIEYFKLLGKRWFFSKFFLLITVLFDGTFTKFF